MKKLTLFIFLSFFALGCATIQEPFKAIWGSSTKALEDNRGSATVKAYQSSYSDCFDKVLEVIHSREKSEIKREVTEDNPEAVGIGGTAEVVEVAGYEIFINDKKKGVIVVIGVPKSINTTEVGIFITALSASETKMEIVSLSSAAQQIVSDEIFEELDKVYSAVVEKSL